MKLNKSIAMMVVAMVLLIGGVSSGWMKTSTTKVAVITDVHHRDDIAQEYWQVFPGDYQYRQFSTAEVRLTAAVDQANTSGCNLFISLGDIVDQCYGNYAGEDLDADIAARLADCFAITDTFTGDGIALAIGNHEKYLWGGVLVDDFDDYWGDVENGHNHVARTHRYSDVDGDSVGYTFDYNHIRFVVMYAYGNDINISSTQLNWLHKGDGTGVLETDLPCVVLAHGVIYVDGVHDTQMYDTVGNSAVVTALFETAGNVKLVMSGHFHRNGIDGYDNQFANTVNGITYLALRGSILGAENGTSSDTATVEDSAHWVIEIEDVGDNWNITVTGYKLGESDSVVVAKPLGLAA